MENSVTGKGVKQVAAALVLACALPLGLGASPAAAVVIEVNQIDPFSATPTAGNWYQNDVRGGGTASIQSLSGLGGNLENSAPLPTGAARVTTGFDNNDKGEIGVSDAFGQVSTIFNSSFSVGYSYHKANVAGGSAAPAPSLKLTFFNGTPGCCSGDGSITLVYEPTWNQPSNPGASVAVPTDVWTTVGISLTSGLFWGTGGFGTPNSFGGPPLRTLGDWAGILGADFLDAQLVQLSVGVGTFNQGQNGYFDNVRFNYDGFEERIYDFELATTAIPEPSTFAIFGVALAGLGFVGRRRKHTASAAMGA